MATHVTSLPALRYGDHVLRPEFVVRLQVGPDETTATLYAYRGEPPTQLQLPWRPDNDVIDQATGVIDVVVGHVNRSRGALVNGSLSRQPLTFVHHHEYDEKGAMYFAIAVILFYGISIAMLVAASTLKRSHSDYELKGFLRSYARLDEERRSDEKQRVRDILLRRSCLMNTAPSPAIVITNTSVADNVAAGGSDQRRPSLSIGPPTTVPQSTCVVEYDGQPTPDVVADRQTIVVCESPATNTPRRASIMASVDGGSRVWPTDNELHRGGGEEQTRRSSKTWLTRTRPRSDCCLSEKSCLISVELGTAMSMSQLSGVAWNWGWNRGGRRNTAV